MSTWLETTAITRVIGLTNGYISAMNENGEGIYFGDDAATKQEYIFDLNAMGAMHAIILGPTRSGKTTAMATWGMRLVNAGFKVIYVTVKPDSTTNYINVAQYFKAGTRLAYGGQQVQIQSCGRSQGRLVDGFFRVSMTINWTAYVPR